MKKGTVNSYEGLRKLPDLPSKFRKYPEVLETYILLTGKNETILKAYNILLDIKKENNPRQPALVYNIKLQFGLNNVQNVLEYSTIPDLYCVGGVLWMRYGGPYRLTGFMLVPETKLPIGPKEASDNERKTQHIIRDVITILGGTLGLGEITAFSAYIRYTRENKMSFLQLARQTGEKENLLPIDSAHDIINEN